MSINYKFIGWCREGTSDKVWAMVQLNGDRWRGDYATIWGRRGRSLQHKIHADADAWDMEKLFEKKRDKGYKYVNIEELNKVYPEFEEDLEKTTMWAILKA